MVMQMEKLLERGVFQGQSFQEGDVLQIELSNGGTKNVYIGRFVCFSIAHWRMFFSCKIRRSMILRHHTICSEGVFRLFIDEVSKITILEKRGEGT